jgi:hypothetical protein
MKKLLMVPVAGLALLAAACGGGPSTGHAAASSSMSTSAVAFAHCMRSHGVPKYPDPAANGRLPKTSAQSLGVGAPAFQAAESACRSLLPANGASFQQQAQQCLSADDCPPALVQRMLTAGRAFAACMRSHGVPGWPDPTVDSEGRPGFNLVPAGITHAQTHSPPISTKLAECQRLDPAPMGLESN